MNIYNLFFLVLFLAVVGIFVYRLYANVKMLRVGQGDEDKRSDQRLARLGYTLVNGFLQPKMLTDGKAALMHYGIFYGFVIVSLGTLETIVEGLFTGFSFASLLGNGIIYQLYLGSQDFANSIVALAIIYALARRMFFPPPRLQSLGRAAKTDAYIILSFILALVGSELLLLGSKATIAPQAGLVIAPQVASLVLPTAVLGNALTESLLWWLHCATLFGFMLFLPFSKHQHLIWVWANMFFKSRKSIGRLRPLKIDEEAESFGASKASDLSWKQLLDGLTCVECGRCTEVCPATTTAKPLDPRLMIHHLKEATFNPKRALVGEIVTAAELWACTTCAACMQACPLDIEHIPAIVDMRRYLTLTEGSFPAELGNTFRNLETNSTPWAFSSSTRADWAQGLDVKQMKDVGEADYLFWVGCAGAYDERYKKVSQALVKIMQQAGVSFAILGTEEQCSGDTARRLGNEYLANMQIEENIRNFKKYKVKKVITGCPHCFNTIKNEYPDYGFAAQEVVHHSQFIAELIAAGKLKTSLPSKTEKITVHDSCYLSRHNDVIDEPRAVLQQEVEELPRNKKQSFCCGAGGGRMWQEETIGTRINENRAQEVIASGAKVAATSCPFCLTMLRDGVNALSKQKQVEVKDIAEVVADRLENTHG
ncbi:MAG: (Fe-S)-binding protein [Pseudomonadota bacterium]|nr:(Fe-S)-binding protein [Pseudomonadota bacterium]